MWYTGACSRSHAVRGVRIAVELETGTGLNSGVSICAICPILSPRARIGAWPTTRTDSAACGRSVRRRRHLPPRSSACPATPAWSAGGVKCTLRPRQYELRCVRCSPTTWCSRRTRPAATRKLACSKPTSRQHGGVLPAGQLQEYPKARAPRSRRRWSPTKHSSVGSTPSHAPTFRANHKLMMKHGEQGLRTFLAGYHAALRLIGRAGRVHAYLSERDATMNGGLAWQTEHTVSGVVALDLIRHRQSNGSSSAALLSQPRHPDHRPGPTPPRPSRKGHPRRRRPLHGGRGRRLTIEPA